MKRSPMPPCTLQRGVTLLEVMVTTLMMSIIVGGVGLFLVGQARTQRSTFDKTDIQRTGRAAMAIIANELTNAGLGLPRALAIRSFDDPGASAGACGGTPELSVAGLDYMREWVVQAAAEGSITLADPVPTGASDAALAAGQWMFIYQNSTDAGADSGFGMVRLGAPRAAGAVTLTIDSTNYSATQTALNLAQAGFNGGTSGSAPAVLAAKVSTFGVDCTDPNRPFLYWQQAAKNVLATNVDTRPLGAAAPHLGAAAGAVVGLRFRFLVDDDRDGRADDTDADGSITASDLVTAPADLGNVVGVEVTFRLRSELPDGQTGVYVVQDFSHIVMLPNVHTRDGQPYIFVHNSGL